MNNLQAQSISTAKQLREKLGGRIFSFPIEDDNPFSKYAVVVYAPEVDKYFVYPNAEDISLAAAGVLKITELFKQEGIDINYDRDVRLISHQAQMDAPSTTMRRLKKGNVSKPFYGLGKDFTKEAGETENISFSARGVLKVSLLEMVDEKNPKATQFMERYYQLLAMRKYGKTAAAIKQEVRKMSKNQAFRWLEQTFENYIHDDAEIMNIFHSLGAN
jgi:hypothetical protein